MSTDLDKHVLAKYDIKRRIGKGVSLEYMYCINDKFFIGLWYCMEECGPSNWRDCGIEENI